MLIAILVVVMVVALVLTVVAAVATKGSLDRGMTVTMLGMVVIFLALIAGNEVGKEQGRLPDMAGLCKVSPGSQIEVTWKAPKDDFEQLRTALLDDAKCKISITKGKVPPAFPANPGQ